MSALTDLLEAYEQTIAELEHERDALKAELRKYEPSDGVMHQLLAYREAIVEAARLLKPISGPGTEHIEIKHEDWVAMSAWLDLPVVKATRKQER